MYVKSRRYSSPGGNWCRCCLSYSQYICWFYLFGFIAAIQPYFLRNNTAVCKCQCNKEKKKKTKLSREENNLKTSFFEFFSFMIVILLSYIWVKYSHFYCVFRLFTRNIKKKNKKNCKKSTLTLLFIFIALQWIACHCIAWSGRKEFKWIVANCWNSWNCTALLQVDFITHFVK